MSGGGKLKEIGVAMINGAAAASLTLMAVCAHPDDESTSVGETLASYADESIRTIVVTCTSAELGDGPGGVIPGEPDHDSQVMRPAGWRSSRMLVSVSRSATLECSVTTRLVWLTGTTDIKPWSFATLPPRSWPLASANY